MKTLTSGLAIRNVMFLVGLFTTLVLGVRAQQPYEESVQPPFVEPLPKALQETRPAPAPQTYNWFIAQSGRLRQADATPAAKPTPPPLTLNDVLQIIERNHPKLVGANVQRQIASAKRLEKQGAFDPKLWMGSDYLRYNSTTTRGKPADTNFSDAGFEFLTRSGIKVAAGSRYNFGRVKSPLSSTGDTGEYFVELKVPLLRGWRINEKSVAERQALLGEPLAEAEFQMTRLELIWKAANSYWDWVAAQRKLIVARDLLSLAEFRARAVTDRVQAGDLPAIDAAEADLEVQRRQGAVVKAERDLQKSAFKLSLFLWTDDGRQTFSPEPEQVPSVWASPAVFTDLQAIEAEKLALERRPELRALTINREITQLDLDLARNERRPNLELSLAPGRDTGFGAIGTTFKGGLNFTLPLRQRTVDGRIGAASFKLQKFDLDQRYERQRISTEVFDAYSAINTSYERYRAAEQEVTLALKLEEGEREKFRLGDSTLFLVNQRERATAEARVKLIEIQAEYEQAVATFRTASVQF